MSYELGDYIKQCPPLYSMSGAGDGSDIIELGFLCGIRTQ